MNTQLQPLDFTLPLGSLDAYMRRVSAMPMLSAEEECALARCYREKGDLEAAKQLILSHLRLVAKVARKYLGYGLPLADLVQEGNVGLMKAVKRFDPEVGVRLVTFALHWIKAEIHEFVLRNWRIVKIATTKAQRKLFFNLRQLKTHLHWFSKNEVDTIAREFDLSPQLVQEMESRLESHDESFDSMSEDDEDDHYSPSQYLTDPTMNPERLLIEGNSAENYQARLQVAMGKLDERSQAILKDRWLVENKMTLQALADRYQVSAERIRQLERCALDQLKKSLEEK
ncbi:MAG: RNA polymerase factor sigma-32 [Gammaproteobacteria bacterium GWE2_42_36]|nr:MAG: RNA polymerase factor sigma-32 [Gammaproteobacteria bacterium GWE2_42_36]HCU05381.1 RNA polymerase sigma factor RpoH [Coxiellaceae bacterium]